MNKKLATYLCCAILAAFAMNLTIISPLLPAISKTFSLSMAEAGGLFTAEFAGFIVFVLIGGFLSDKFGKKPVVAIALFGFFASILLFTMTDVFFIAMLLMVFIGGFGGIIESMATAMVSDMNEVNRSFYVNLSQVFFGIGAIIGPLVGGIIISTGTDWRICYYILTVMVLIPAIIFAFSKFPALPKAEAIALKDFWGALKNWKFLAVCLCLAFYTGSEVGGWGWLSTLLKDNMGFSVAKAGIAVAVFWIAMTAGRFICGPLTFKFKLRSIIIALAASSSVITLLAVFTGSEILVWLVIIAMGLTYSSQYPLLVDFGTGKSTATSGISMALLMSCGSVGGMLVPYFMGAVGDFAGLRFAMIIPAVLLLLVAIVLAGFGENKNAA